MPAKKLSQKCVDCKKDSPLLMGLIKEGKLIETSFLCPQCATNLFKETEYIAMELVKKITKAAMDMKMTTLPVNKDNAH